jgi:succinyl-CoA synthetase beta subunit
VIRLQGTNVEQAKMLIEGRGFRMIMADNLEDAAQKVVGVHAEKIHVGVEFDGFKL